MVGFGRSGIHGSACHHGRLSLSLPVGCPCGPIYDVGEAYDDPQAQYLKMTKPAPHTSLGDVNLILGRYKLAEKRADDETRG